MSIGEENLSRNQKPRGQRVDRAMSLEYVNLVYRSQGGSKAPINTSGFQFGILKDYTLEVRVNSEKKRFYRDWKLACQQLNLC